MEVNNDQGDPVNYLFNTAAIVVNLNSG